MSFLDSAGGGPSFPLGGSSFGDRTVAAAGFGAPSGFGGGESKLTGTNAPGTVSPFDQQTVGRALHQNEEAMTNRYAQLGLSGQGATPTSPGGPAGGIGVQNIGTGMLPWQTSPGVAAPAGAPGAPPPGSAATPTAEQMDLGMLPSLTGGLPGEAEALLGQIQNNNMQAAGGSSGGGGKGGGGKGGIGSMMGPMMMMGGK